MTLEKCTKYKYCEHLREWKDVGCCSQDSKTVYNCNLSEDTDKYYFPEICPMEDMS